LLPEGGEGAKKKRKSQERKNVARKRDVVDEGKEGKGGGRTSRFRKKEPPKITEKKQGSEWGKSRASKVSKGGQKWLKKRAPWECEAKPLI